MALVSANRKRVTIEGPVCNSAEVIGWHLKRMNHKNVTEEDAKAPLHISSFAFNSSILWDPERWGRPSSVQDTSQVGISQITKLVFIYANERVAENSEFWWLGLRKTVIYNCCWNQYLVHVWPTSSNFVNQQDNNP